MMTDCTCEHVTAEVIQCPIHFHLFKAGKRLASVGSIIKATFPLDPKIPADVLENARDRGSQVDVLFAGYVNGTLTTFPVGTRHDARELSLRLFKWYDRQQFKKVEVQVVLGDSDHGGVLDFAFDDMPTELKATSQIDHTHRLQAAGYANLCHNAGQILHITERLKEPRLVPLEQSDYDDWQCLLAHWRMKERRAK